MSEPPTLSAAGLETYLRCPRRYEFAHVHGLEGDVDDPTADRVDLLRTAICDALRSGATDRDALAVAALDRLETLWNDHDERFHSLAQRRHERRVLEATVDAYLERVGVDHAEGIARLEAEASAGEVIGPALPVSSTRSLPDDVDAATGTAGGATVTVDGSTATDDGTEPSAVRIDAPVDYVTVDGASLVGVRFVPTLAPLGLLRYRSEWEGDVAALFVDHFDPDAAVFEPGPVGALFETSVVLDGLRTLAGCLDLEDRTCRYVRIPLADRSRAAVNWVQGTVETTLETVDLTEVYVDHRTFGMTHEHRNETVDSRLAATAAEVVAGAFDPGDRWDRIAADACPDCEYAVCCQDRIAAEVRFDG